MVLVTTIQYKGLVMKVTGRKKGNTKKVLIKRNGLIWRMDTKGVKAKVIADVFDISLSQVYYILARRPK
jgi:hypothetical protein